MLFLSLSVSMRLFYAMLSVPVVNIQTVQVSESFRSAYFFGFLGSIGFFHWKKHRKAPKALSVFEGFVSYFFSPQVEVIFGHFLEMREKFEGYRRKKHIFGWGIEWNPSILLGVTQVGQILWHHEHPWCNTISSNDVRVDHATPWQPAGGIMR